MFTRIRELREFEDYSMSQIARKLGVSKGTYSMWEYGDLIPLKRLIQLANVYHVKLDYLVNLTNVSKNNKAYDIQIDKSLVASNLLSLRKKLNYSQEKIASKINVSQSAWKTYEKGYVLITTVPLYELCKKFNLSMEDILYKSSL